MTRSLSVAVLAFLALAPALSSAELIKVVAEGPLKAYFDPDGLLAIDEPAPGTRLRMEFTYEDTTNPLPGSPLFLGAIVNIRLWVGDEVVGPFSRDLMFVIDGDPAVAEESDALFLRSQDLLPLDPAKFPGDEPGNTEEIFFLAFDEGSQALTSGALTEVPWTLDAWPIPPLIAYEFSFQETPGEPETDLARVTADVDTLSATVVPLPAPVLLLGSALLAMGLVRGDQRRPFG